MNRNDVLKKNLMFQFLILATIAATAGFQGWRTLFANFAVEVGHINGFQMGVIQSLREIPGFLVFLVVFVLLFLKEHTLSAISIIIIGMWIALTGFFPSYFGLIATTFIMSIGFHFQETTNQSLITQYFSNKGVSEIFGKIRSVQALTNICVGAGIWLLATLIPMKYIFVVLGAVVALFGAYLLTKDPLDKDMPVQHKKLVLKRKYWLYYALNFFAGARRQIFIVFSVFLLVEHYKLSVQWITLLFMIANIINYFLSPFIGRCINRLGERKMLSLEYISLIAIFLVYAFVENHYVAALFYVIDQLFFNFAIGIQTYFKKTAEHQDIAPSTAVGFAINHISAVVIPVIGGMLWVYNWKIPFVFGAFLSVISLILAQRIRIPKENTI